MARLRPGDVREIVQMLKDGMSRMQGIVRTEKMKMRSRVRRQFSWLSGLNSPAADMIFHKLEEGPSDVFSLYPYGYSDKVRRLLEEKSARFHSMRGSPGLYANYNILWIYPVKRG